MRPLTEWTDAELHARLGDDPYDTLLTPARAADVLAEVLRRERERCAAVCEAGSRHCDGDECAARIRALT